MSEDAPRGAGDAAPRSDAPGRGSTSSPAGSAKSSPAGRATSSPAGRATSSATRSSSDAGGSRSALPQIEEELRLVQVRADALRERMRASIDLFGTVTFGVTFAGLVLVSVLAIVAMVQDETGVAMLFSALTLVALPLAGAAAWRGFGPAWTLSRELGMLRRQEAALYEQVATQHAAAPSGPV
ncbi:MAG TPA: hypothetical protein VGR21_05565, partial [Cryptosporangiaceae bacterium]|nr:hypothetical protein [Cryptosporangiaceae bacterium]